MNSVIIDSYDKICGHEPIIEFLKRISLDSIENIPRNFIFIGPRNVGKKTVAKIFSESLKINSEILSTFSQNDTQNLNTVYIYTVENYTKIPFEIKQKSLFVKFKPLTSENVEKYKKLFLEHNPINLNNLKEKHENILDFLQDVSYSRYLADNSIKFEETDIQKSVFLILKNGFDNLGNTLNKIKNIINVYSYEHVYSVFLEILFDSFKIKNKIEIETHFPLQDLNSLNIEQILDFLLKNKPTSELHFLFLFIQMSNMTTYSNTVKQTTQKDMLQYGLKKQELSHGDILNQLNAVQIK